MSRSVLAQGTAKHDPKSLTLSAYCLNPAPQTVTSMSVFKNSVMKISLYMCSFISTLTTKEYVLSEMFLRVFECILLHFYQLNGHY